MKQGKQNKFYRTKRKLKANEYFNFGALDNLRISKATREINSRRLNTLKKELRNTFKVASIIDPSNIGVYKKAIREIDTTNIKDKMKLVSYLYDKYSPFLDKHMGADRDSTKTFKTSLALTKSGKERKRYGTRVNKSKRKYTNKTILFNAKKAFIHVIKKHDLLQYFDEDGNYFGIDYLYMALSEIESEFGYGESFMDLFFESHALVEETRNMYAKLNRRGKALLEMIKRDDLSLENYTMSKYKELRRFKNKHKKR